VFCAFDHNGNGYISTAELPEFHRDAIMVKSVLDFLGDPMET
jgi:hypothetical protein